MTKSKLPVSSFGPELQDALRAGSNTQIELVFETPSMAVRFASRINALRSAMRREGHSESDRLYRAGVSIKGCTVVIAPKDSEFRDVLKRAGIAGIPPSPTVHQIDVATPRPGVVDDPATSFLQTLTEATTVGAVTGRFTSNKPNFEEVEKSPPPSDKSVD